MSPSLDILLVDPDEGARHDLARALSRLGFSCRTAASGEAALELLAKAPADAIISEWACGTIDGPELCRRVRALRGGYTYFLFLTGYDDKLHFLRAMEAGADDYHAKPTDLEELQARLRGAARLLGVFRSLSAQNLALQRDSKKMFWAARIDPLTQIPNRLRLAEDLEAFRSNGARYGHRYAVALCDIDDFKHYNDQYGHPAGDEVLRHIAATLRASLRHGDGLYRYGGEEFLIVLAEHSARDARRALERARLAVERLGVPQVVAAAAARPGLRPTPPAPRPLTISIGCADLDPRASPDDSVKAADAALYLAKARGKNRVELAVATAPRSAPSLLADEAWACGAQ